MKSFNSIVAKTFNISEASVTDSLSSRDIPDWDSMNYLLFIAALEKEFAVSFSMDEVLHAQTLGAIRLILESKHNHGSQGKKI